MNQIESDSLWGPYKRRCSPPLGIGNKKGKPGAPVKIKRPISVSCYSVPPIWRDRALFRCIVDGFVQHTPNMSTREWSVNPAEAELGDGDRHVSRIRADFVHSSGRFFTMAKTKPIPLGTRTAPDWSAVVGLSVRVGGVLKAHSLVLLVPQYRGPPTEARNNSEA